MKTVIDSLTSGTGWSGTGTVHAINELADYISGINSASTVFYFSASGKYIEKSFTNNLTGYDELILSLWSRNKKSYGDDYLDPADFAYKIGIYSGVSTVHEYYLPTYKTFEPVGIKISEGAITKIRITFIGSGEDYLCASNLMAAKDELPLDIFKGLKEQLDDYISAHYDRVTGGVNGSGILIGTLTASAGEKTLLFPATKFMQKYSVFKIVGGGNSEIHQVDTTDEEQVALGQMYDGPALKYTYSAASVYLVIPVNYGLAETEILLPGIAIWGMPAEELPMETTRGESRDTYALDGTSYSRYNFLNYKYQLQIDCEARHNELIGFMSLIIRCVLAHEYIWVNGKKYNIKANGVPTFIEPSEGYNEIPKMSFLADLNIREDVFDRVLMVKTTAQTIIHTILGEY